MRGHHRQRPFLLPQLRQQALSPPIPLLLALLLVLLQLLPLPVEAAEVLQVRGPRLLQIGDGNRSYAVELACLQVESTAAEAAERWLRRELPRRSRVNLRPIGSRDGQLLARITRLGDGEDLSGRLIAAGLARDDADPPGCSPAVARTAALSPAGTPRDAQTAG